MLTTALPYARESVTPSLRPRRALGRVMQGTVVSALGGLLFGFDTAVISGTTGALQRAFGLDAFWLGFTVATALIGTIAGSIGVGPVTDRFGRRKALTVLATFYFVSALGCAVATDWPTFVLARALGGLAIGGASVVAPLYIAEIAPAHLRGRLVAVNQLNVVSGILLSFVSNWLLAQWLDPQIAWRWMLGVVAVPSAAFFLLSFTIPESPRWLVKRGRSEEARSVLRSLGELDVEGELWAITASLLHEPGGSEERLFQRRYAWPVFLTWAVAMFNQLSGINALMYYAPTIFALAGATRQTALLQAVAVGGTNLLATIAAMFLIDRFGRRVLLLVGSVGTAVCLGVVSRGLEEHYRAPIILAALLGYIAFFAASQGAVIWVFISEVFPNAVRAKGQALGSFTHWVMAAAVSWTFPVLSERSASTAFAFFSGMMVLQFVFAWKVMPETKGGTLEDIETRLASSTPYEFGD